MKWQDLKDFFITNIQVVLCNLWKREFHFKNGKTIKSFIKDPTDCAYSQTCPAFVASPGPNLHRASSSYNKSWQFWELTF